MPVRFHDPIPVLHIFDYELAKRFYVNWLGFKIDWEHTFEPGMPRYISISQGGVVLHLTEHYGDCCPGATCRIRVDDLEEYHRELQSRPNSNMHPCVELASWNSLEMEVIDPFGNRIRFNQPLELEGKLGE